MQTCIRRIEIASPFTTAHTLATLIALCAVGITKICIPVAYQHLILYVVAFRFRYSFYAGRAVSTFQKKVSYSMLVMIHMKEGSVHQI